LIDRFCFLSESSKFAQIISDYKHFPFFYHLGKRIQPKRLLEIGFGLGFVSGCFLQGCKTVEEFTAYQHTKDEYYSFLLGRRNIFSVYKNKFTFINDIHDTIKLWYDLAIINDDDYIIDDYRSILDIVWDSLAYGGILVIDHVKYGGDCKQVLPDFFKVANRKPVFVNTRYGVALIKK
jgi:predicted O-methyltransferase YrrM